MNTGGHIQALESPYDRTVKDVSAYFGVSARTVMRWIASRRLRHFKVGHFIRFSQADLEEFKRKSIREATI